MSIQWVLQTIVIFIVGIFILRMGGRKSISQMTISQTVVMIGIGSLLIQPVSGHGLGNTFLAAATLVILMVITEHLALKFDKLESLFSGKAVIVVENGKPNLHNLKKLRLSIDRLETRLRQVGISSIEHLQWATLEVSGQVGYELKQHKQPATKEDIQLILLQLDQINKLLSSSVPMPENTQEGNNIFAEIQTKKFEGNNQEP